MKRIVLLTVLTAMMAAAMALSGVAQAKPITNGKADAKCLVEAVRTVEDPGFNPSDYSFHGGTEGDDFSFQTTEGQPDVICGFGGRDTTGALDASDIFLGGDGDDFLRVNEGTFNGGAGNDQVGFNSLRGTVNGGDGDDLVATNFGTFNGEAGNDSVGGNSGIFHGGLGDDSVDTNATASTFYGGEGNDSVRINNATFYGEEGNDSVEHNSAVATFDGGPGIDTVFDGPDPVDGP